MKSRVQQTRQSEAKRGSRRYKEERGENTSLSYQRRTKREKGAVNYSTSSKAGGKAKRKATLLNKAIPLKKNWQNK